MPTEDVHRAPFAGDVEGDLGRCRQVRVAQKLENAFDHSCVVAIKEAIKLLTLPEDAHKQSGTKRGEDPLERLYRDSICVTALDTRDL